jgi:MFS family permease
MNIKLYKTIKDLKEFLLLWSSQSISTLGSSMTSYALLIWVYQQKASVMSVALLAVCSYLPSIIFSFFAGVFVDRWDKKRIMLICDTIAAIGTLILFILMIFGKLCIWHIYSINMVTSLMNSFQGPAFNVAVSEIVNKENYHRISGLKSMSSSLITILTPTFATAILALADIQVIMIIDLFTFFIAFLSLLFFIKIPKRVCLINNKVTRYFEDCLLGLEFLKEHSPLMKLILFFTFINLIAFIGGGGITTTVTSMILARTNQNEVILGMFSSAVGIGTLIASVCVTLMKPPKSKIKVIFIACAASFFLSDVLLGVGKTTWIWIFAGLAGNLPLPLLNANLDVIMRTHIPIEMQGRVFSTRNTLQYCTIPIGYFLSGILADYIFEPFMNGYSSLHYVFAKIVGEGNGSGIAVMLLVTGVIGTIVSLYGLKIRCFKQLDYDI